MNYENPALLIDDVAPDSAEMLPAADAVSAELECLRAENRMLRTALEIIEHTLKTIKGK